MIKALLKKQMMGVFSWLYKDKKSGKNRSVQGVIAFAALYIFIFASLGVLFYQMADMLCQPLVSVGMGWIYWCIMGLIGLCLGVFGSVFSTYSSLYRAQDNDLLFSMPLPTFHILFARLFGVYITGLMYELIVLVPAVAVWLMQAPTVPLGVVFVLLLPLILSVLVLVLSAMLGWVVALIAGKLKHKNFITVIASLAFIAVYYYLYSNVFAALQALLDNAAAVGEKVKFILYPLYQMGLAAEGRPIPMLIFTAIVGVLFLAVFLALSRSFWRLAVSNRDSTKAVYKEKVSKIKSVRGALLQKELRRFLSSANYMLNCGLGIIFMPIAAVLIFWKGGMLREMLADPTLQPYAPLLAVVAVCTVATMSDIVAPSVSLEGKNLWLVQSFPVAARQVLRAKLELHLLLTVIPAIPLVVAVEWLIRPSPVFAALIPVATLLFILLMAVVGLSINLKMPHLDWTNEIIPIKQSLGVTLTLFGGWAILLALAGLYMAVSRFVSPLIYLVLVCLLLTATVAILFRWLMKRGADIFSTL